MSKRILENKEVMNIVLAGVVGDHAKDQYVQQGREWLDGKRTNILYIPVKPSSDMPPVIVEVQNTVDNSFIRRLQQYCSHVYNQQGDIDPVVLTLCVETVRTELANDFENSEVASFLKVLPSKYWAKNHFILAPITIQAELNDPNKQLHPLVALQYVFQKQACSLQSLEFQHDPTVKFLYSLAKDALDHQVSQHQETVDVLVDVCTETKNQFKRILDALDEDSEGGYKRARAYASAGVLYSETCSQKYKIQSSEDTSMPEPPELPEGVKASTGREPIQVLRAIEPEQVKSDMQFIDEFVEDWLKTHNRISWAECFSEGKKQGYLQNYRNKDSLKSTYYELKKKKQSFIRTT
ncbi:hypothetical protein BDC45DRAFT_535087 [Circinella umbellata]|nr:hypothetical protein BDC45DRAFT_535087 [Circinella umbellata]